MNILGTLYGVMLSAKRYGDCRAEWWTGALLGSKFEQAWYSTVSMSSALNLY